MSGSYALLYCIVCYYISYKEETYPMEIHCFQDFAKTHSLEA